MGTYRFIFAFCICVFFSNHSIANEYSTKEIRNQKSAANSSDRKAKTQAVNIMDELDPYSPDIQQQLQALDQAYYQNTGRIPFIGNEFEVMDATSCFRNSCNVWAQVSRRQQKMYLYVEQNLYATWATSTGALGHETPNFDRHPNGRIYDAYSSIKYPGGDYNGLGNMPYAVFIEEGFAVHGTGRNNWPLLGRPASHGCVRIHPDNAYIFNRLVRKYGIANVWITVAD